MSIALQLKYRIEDLHLRDTFAISRRSFDRLDSLIVRLEGPQGVYGLGEATHNPYYPNTTMEVQTAALERARAVLEAGRWENAEELWQALAPVLEAVPFAQCALDQAAQDLFARRAGVPLYQHWGLPQATTPVSCYTLGLADIPTLLRKMEAMPWPVYKIKLGVPEDLLILKALREHTDAVFRVDANCAWEASEAIEKSHALRDLGVEFIEQPLPAEDWEGMARVYEASALPVLADEACKTQADIPRCAECFHGINIKLMKCGGLTPALAMIREAKTLGLQVMVGCMTESSVGISAIAQLLPLLDYVDMDGALLLANDPARGVVVTPSGAVFPQQVPGTGATLIVDF